jgi:hypothetical protein
MLVQLELFETRSENDILQEEIGLLKKSQDKMRKALFARHGELAKHYIEIHNRLEILERYICKK